MGLSEKRFMVLASQMNTLFLENENLRLVQALNETGKTPIRTIMASLQLKTTVNPGNGLVYG